MDQTEARIVPRALSAYKRGDYRTAKWLYEEAARRYGDSLFSANLTLCEKALRNSDCPIDECASGGSAATTSEGGLPGNDATSAISRQLAETQSLLEKYFIRCQELEQQMLYHQEGRNTP